MLRVMVKAQEYANQPNAEKNIRIIKKAMEKIL